MVGLLIVLLLSVPPLVAAQEPQDNYTREELTQMLAPVALYPDDLLSQVLMAATYPLEVVEADRWVKKNPMLTGDNLDEALKHHDWDASVKALCHIPTVLALMSEKLDETTQLGNAFLAQESEVMSLIQDLRHKAYQEGNLLSNDKQTVTLEANGTIVIGPANPRTVYVPYYNTRYVYGDWWYPAWPPWYWGPDVVVGAGIHFWPNGYYGFGFGFGYWSYFDWPRRIIVINTHRRPHFFRNNYNWSAHRGTWRHDPDHRRGIAYRNRSIAEKFSHYRDSDGVTKQRSRRTYYLQDGSVRSIDGTLRGNEVRKSATTLRGTESRTTSPSGVTKNKTRTERTQDRHKQNEITSPEVRNPVRNFQSGNGRSPTETQRSGNETTRKAEQRNSRERDYVATPGVRNPARDSQSGSNRNVTVQQEQAGKTNTRSGSSKAVENSRNNGSAEVQSRGNQSRNFNRPDRDAAQGFSRERSGSSSSFDFRQRGNGGTRRNLDR